MTNFKIRLVGLLSGVFLATTVLGDHLPLKDQAKGRPEKKLAGIVLDVTTVADVKRIYGKPSEVEKEPKPANLNVVDTYHYRWFKPGIKLHLVVFHFEDTKNGEYIALVEIEGSQAAGRQYRTGRGLKIGDGLADIRRIYGPRYKLSDVPTLNIHDVTIQWRVEEFSLVADLDKKGKITKISLFAPE